jgi:HicB family
MGQGGVGLSVSAQRPTLEAVHPSDAPGESEGAAKKGGRPEQPPNDYSGRLLLRMPKQLHAALARASEAEHLSLNAFINDALERAVGSQAGASSRAGGTRAATRDQPGEAKTERSPAVSWLLVANLIVLALVGILAIALIVRTL